MQFKSIVAAAGAVLLATAGAAQAGDSFETLAGVVTSEMSQTELFDVRGANVEVESIPVRTDVDLNVGAFSGMTLLVDVDNPPAAVLTHVLSPSRSDETVGTWVDAGFTVTPEDCPRAWGQHIYRPDLMSVEPPVV